MLVYKTSKKQSVPLATEDFMSKAIADKADIGFIMNEVDNVELEQVSGIVEKVGIAPTHVIDLYKIRSGRFKGARIWTYLNNGNGYRKDLFVTTADNQPIVFEDYEIVESKVYSITKLDLNYQIIAPIEK